MPKKPLLDQPSHFHHEPHQVGTSLASLSDQLRDGFVQAARVKLPAEWKNIRQVVVAGMGGSHLAADIIAAAFADRLRRPLIVLHDATLPAWVTKETLVIATSYSGTTAETLQVFQLALKRKVPLMAITSGGLLASAATRAKTPLLRFIPQHNPSKQPRLGVAYSFAAIMTVLRKIKALAVSEQEIESWVSIASRAHVAYGPDRSTMVNKAKQVAMIWNGHQPLLFSGEWASGNMHTFANQIHENAKTFASWYPIPELNHHLMEGLRNRQMAKQFSALFVIGQADAPHAKRFTLTQGIIKRLGISTSTFRPRGNTVAEQAVDLLAFGGYVSWYLAILRRVDPAAIPTVDELKRKL